MPKTVEKRLTALQVKKLTKPGRHADGGGLYLTIKESGSKSWTLRVTVKGSPRVIGLGSARDVSLAEARDEASRLRKAIAAGRDPIAERDGDDRSSPTFKEAAEAFLAERHNAWGNAKHRQQWPNTLRDYVYPRIGAKPVDTIESNDILEVLVPIWQGKPETARRVKQRMHTIFDWCLARHYRSTMNPVDAVRAALPRQSGKKRHFASLPYDEVPLCLAAVRSSRSALHIRLSLEFLVLTAARTGEVLGATRSEIDGDVWTIPADRMKAGVEHRVPLAPRCMEILAEADVFPHAELIFPGRDWKKPLSNMAFSMMLRRLGYGQITVHGFRSSFRDWAAEQTSFSRDVCEAALAHTVENQVEAAYRRTTFFNKRRLLMQQWAEYLEQRSANVLPLKGKRE